MPQPFRLRHLANVEAREIDLVQQMIKQRLITAAIEFFLQASKVSMIPLRAADTVGMKNRRAVLLTGTKWSELLVIVRFR